MNLQKAQLKAAIVENIGVSIEDDLEVARVKVHKSQGSAEALVRAKQVLADLTVKARDEVLNGVVEFDSGNPMEVAKYVIARIQEGAAKLHELAEHARLLGLQAEGEVNGLERVVKKIQGIRDEERKKVEAFMKAVDEGKVIMEDGSPRFIGDGPAPPGTVGLPIKMIREREEAAEAAAAAAAAATPSKPRERASKRKKAKAGADDRDA